MAARHFSLAPTVVLSNSTTSKTLYDVGTVERMQEGKTYPAGTILIILSAISNNTEPVKYCRQTEEGLTQAEQLKNAP